MTKEEMLDEYHKEIVEAIFKTKASDANCHFAFILHKLAEIELKLAAMKQAEAGNDKKIL
jgi:hypothetical protein